MNAINHNLKRSNIMKKNKSNLSTLRYCCINKIFKLQSEPILYIIMMFLTLIYCILKLFKTTSLDDPTLFENSPYLDLFNILYAIDIALNFAYQTAQLRYVRYLSHRPLWVIIIEIISVIPFSYIINAFVKLDHRYNTYIESLHALKIVRLIYNIYFSELRIHVRLITRVLTILSSIVIMLFVGFAITFNLRRYLYHFTDTVINRYHALIKCAGIITSFGFPALTKAYSIYFLMAVIICNTLPGFFVNGILIAGITYDYILMNAHKIHFRNSINMFKTQSLMMVGNKTQVVKLIYQFYNKLWKHQKGYTFNRNLFEVLPDAMQREILLDTFCVALKHSTLFRKCDIVMGRFLTSTMRQRYYAPGEYVYEMGEYKDKMIYVVSGIIQIVSAQDEQTPIISLSSGTCLGEISLIERQICTARVRCENYVELQILHRKDFMQLAKYYPDQFRLYLKEAKDRYKNAMTFHKIVNSLNVENRNTIIWLNDIIVSILSNEKRHEFGNLYIETELELDKMASLPFLPDYIDLLVLSDRGQLTEDAEFIRTSFPYILHPNALLLKIWELYLIVTCIILLFFQPAYIFAIEVPKWFYIYSIVVDYTFILDLCIQLCTGIVHKDVYYSTVNDIAKYRFKSWTFYLDIFAIVPFEVFTITFVTGQHGFNELFMKMNRLVKSWRLFKLFYIWGNKLHVDIAKLVYARFSMYLLYFIYIVSYLLYASNCRFKPFDCEYSSDYSTIYSAIQIVTGIGIRGGYDKLYHENIIYLMAIVIAYVSFIMISVYCITTGLLNSTDKIKLEKLIIEISSIFKMHQIEEQFSNRIHKYIDVQWYYNRGMSLHVNDDIKSCIPTYLYKNLCEASFASTLREMLFFQNLSDEIISEMCNLLNYTLLPSNEVICYAGDIANNLIILSKGMCEIIGTECALCDKPTVLNPLAFICQVPTIRTCNTKTHCSILTLSYANFMCIINKYPGIGDSFGLNWKYNEYYAKQMKQFVLFDTSLHVVEPEVPWSIYNFGCVLDEKSKQAYDYYHVPFYRCSNFRFVKYFLMRITINPNGKFFIVYEIIRSVIAIVTVTLHATYYIIVSDGTYWFIILIVLDVIPFLDLYVRLHVCYFNDDGILVKHPLLTAKRYLTHGFVLDLLACLPIERVVNMNRTQHGTTYQCLHVNRFLQLYRYYRLRHYIGNKDLKPKSKWYYFSLSPFVILTSLFVGSIILTRKCVLDPNIKQDGEMKIHLEDGIECDEQFWLIQSLFKKPISPLRAQLYSFYVVSSCLTTIGMQGFTLQNNRIGLIIATMSIVGYYFSLQLLNKFVTYLSATSDVLSMYQSSLLNLKDTMKYRHISYKLQQLIVNHYDMRWNRQRGKNVINLIQNIHYTLQQDILYHIYGHAIYENSIFPIEGTKFIRNLILFAKHETFMIGANIVSVNDVNSFTHIIYKGTVNVIASDGTILDQLDVGSVFGNLDGLPYVRQKMNFVAGSVVEILSIDSVQFFCILNNYQSLKKVFLFTTGRFVHYFPSKRNRQNAMRQNMVMTTYYEATNLTEGFKVINKLRTIVLDPNAKFIRVWLAINFVASYVSILMYMYQMGLSEFNVYYVCVQYFLDVVCIVNFYVKDHLAYENERGHLVKDLKDIKRHNRKNKFQYALNVISILPADVGGFILPASDNTKYVIFKVLRVNRLLRIKSIIQYFEFYTQRITTKIALLQICSLLLYLLLLVMATSCGTILLCSFFEDNMSIPIPTNMLNLPASVKIELIVTYLFDKMNAIARIAQMRIFPNGALLIAWSSLQMTLYIFVWALMYSKICVNTFKAHFLKTLFGKKFYGVVDFLDKQEISQGIAFRIKRYLYVIWIRYEGVIYPYLLKHAPIYIKEPIMCEMYMSYINDSVIFKKCHYDFKRQLLCNLKPIFYLPGDYVTFKGTMDNNMYCISIGTIEVLDEDNYGNETIIGTLNSNNWFGVVQGVDSLVGQKYNYKSIDYTVVLTLHMNDWKYLLEFFPASYMTIVKEIAVYEE